VPKIVATAIRFPSVSWIYFFWTKSPYNSLHSPTDA
jgi:hypothetical protein